MPGVRRSLASALLLVGSAAAAASSDDLVALYVAVPAPPADLALAEAWVEDGRIVAADLVMVESRITAQLAAPGVTVTSAPGAPEIDEAAVLAGVAAYRDYLAAHPSGGGPLLSLKGRLDSIGQGYAGLKQRTRIPELVRDIRQRELASHAALFADWRSKRKAVVEKAQRRISAVGDLAAIRNPEHRAALQDYRVAMLHEARALAAVTRQAVEAAAGISTAAVPEGTGPATLWDLMSNRPGK